MSSGWCCCLVTTVELSMKYRESFHNIWLEKASTISIVVMQNRGLKTVSPLWIAALVCKLIYAWPCKGLLWILWKLSQTFVDNSTGPVSKWSAGHCMLQTGSRLARRLQAAAGWRTGCTDLQCLQQGTALLQYLPLDKLDTLFSTK